jgi:hypothetical protein
VNKPEEKEPAVSKNAKPEDASTEQVNADKVTAPNS